MTATITDATETTITVWREGRSTRWNRLRHWVRRRLESIRIGRTFRRIKAGDVIQIVEGDS